jgi:hypothetical protein
MQACGSAFLASARIELCWVAPSRATSVSRLPRHMQTLLMRLQPQRGEGQQQQQPPTFAILLPLLPAGCKATLQPAGDSGSNGLAVHLDSGNADITHSSWPAALLVAASHDPFHLCDVAVAAAAAIAGGLGMRAGGGECVVPRLGRATLSSAGPSRSTCRHKTHTHTHTHTLACRWCQAALGEAAARHMQLPGLVHVGRILHMRLSARHRCRPAVLQRGRAGATLVDYR